MKRVLVLVAFMALAAAAFAGEAKFGKPLKLKQPVAIATLLEKPGQYVGKTVQVKGKITEVCQMMGCWMMISDDAGKAVKIKVKDGEIVFPKDSAGKTAVAEGKFAKVSAAAAKEGHEDAPQPAYQIEGSGAVILD